MVDKLYHGANLGSSFRPIVHFAVEIQCFVIVPPPVIKKFRSKGIDKHTYGVSA